MQKFKEGTTVYTADGDKVGDIERFVLDPQAGEISGLIVEKGFLFEEERVVPMDEVEFTESGEEKVVLRTEADPDNFPLFEETHYVTPDETKLQPIYQRDFITPVYYYPPVGAATWSGTVVTPNKTETHRNIPQDQLALKEGANVISSDGKHVGDVEEVIASNGDSMAYLVISKGLLFKEEKHIPANWLEKIEEDEVHLVIDSEFIESLESD